MTKEDLIDAVAADTGLTKKDVRTVLGSILGTIIDSVARDEKVSLVGFGVFERRFRSARDGVVPGTTEKIRISESHYPAFKAGKPFKEAVE